MYDLFDFFSPHRDTPKTKLFCRFVTVKFLFFFSLFYKWSQGEERPGNGTLLQLVTKDGKTEFIPAKA